jgi:polyhydroxybutyrate depolymerase
MLGLAAVCAAIAALLPLALAGAGPTPRSPAAGDAAGACGFPPGRTVRISVKIDGQRARSALVHLPRGPRARLPLVLALHGAYANGAFMERYSGLSRLADREGFAVVYPDAAGQHWRITDGEGAGDVQFVDALLDRLLTGGCFDARRVSAVGVSNGGGMAARLACSGQDRLAGLVTVAGAYGPLPACLARRPLSVLEIHGTADQVVPYRGTPDDRRTDVLQWVRSWADRDACSSQPRRTRLRPAVVRLDWLACRGGTSVAHLRLEGGTHAWPGADPPDPGPQLGISASDEAWEFVRGLRLAPLREHDDG